MTLFSLSAFPSTSSGASSLLRIASSILAVATAPLLLELLTLTAGSLLPRQAVQSGTKRDAHSSFLHSLTVVVPAHNEAALVGRCVRSLLADLPAAGSVLVVAHNCTDSTAAVATEAGASVLVLNDDGSEGKGAALRAGFRLATERGASVQAVVDADSVVAPGFSAAILDALAHGADAFQSRYIVRGGEDEARTRLMALGFLGFNVVRPRGRSRLGLSAGIFGNGFGLRSSVLERVPYEASSLVEDLEYHLRLVDAGIRVIFLEDATVSSEMPTAAAAASSQRARWEGGRMRMRRVWLPRLLGRVLRGRLRLLEPALELTSLTLASEVALLSLSLLLPVTWLRLYALAGFAVLLGHVGCAAAEGNNWRVALQTLLSVPRYMFWKLGMLPRILASARQNAAWVRTERERAPHSSADAASLSMPELTAQSAEVGQ